MSTQLLLVSTNTNSQANAKKLARLAVEGHFAASANIQAIDTVYTWKGQIHENAEWRVTFKTTSFCRADLFDLIRKTHGYEVPAFEVLHLDGASQAYQEWVLESCRGNGFVEG